MISFFEGSFLPVGFQDIAFCRPLNPYSKYALFVKYVAGVLAKDKVSKESLDATGLTATRYGYDGDSFGDGEAVIEDTGLLTNGDYVCSGVYSEDATEWSGAGPWTITLPLTELTTYTLSTDVSGATVVVTAGTAILTSL